MASKSEVTIKVNPKALKGAVAKAIRPRFRAAGDMVAAQVRADLSRGGGRGGGAGKSGTLAKAIVVRKRGLGVRVGAKSGTEEAAAIMRIQSGFTGRDRSGRIYSQPGRPVFGPVLSRTRSAIVRMIAGG